MKIFLLEDDFSLNKIIKQSLENRGFIVTSVNNGYDAATTILDNPFDLYILDLNVSGFNGHEILKIIKDKDVTSSVIMISAEIDIENIKKSYEFGCSDYLKKPFDFEELFLRIKYHLKHNTTNDENEEFSVNLGSEYSYDLIHQQLFKHGHEIELSSKEKLLMTLLVKNINKTVTLEMIHEYVWESKDLESVSMRSIIHKLRTKLKSGMLVNLRGVGYKLIN